MAKTPADQAQELAEALERQFDAYGKTARQAKIYELAVKGATDADLAMARSFDAMLTKMEKAQAAQERYNRAVQAGAQGAGRIATAAAGVVGAQASGRAATTAEGVAAMNQALSAIPVAGQLIGSVLGPVFSALYAQTERLNASISSAMQSIVTGSRTADQALGRIRIDAFASEFQRVTTLAQNRRTGTFTVRQQSEEEIARQLRTDMQQGAIFAERAALSLRQAIDDPTVRAALRDIHIGTARQNLRDASDQTYYQIERTQRTRQFLRLGTSVEEARDFGAELEQIQTLAAQLFRRDDPLDSWERAMARANAQLHDLLEGQRRLNTARRQEAAGLQLDERSRQDRDRNEGLRQSNDFLRLQSRTGVQLVDVSQELNQLQLDRNRNLITQVDFLARSEQLLENARVQQERMNVEDVNRRTQGTRRPLEQFALERQRLEQLRGEFFDPRRGPEGPEAFMREQARVAQQLFQSVGPLERLGPAFEQGSVAAMSAARAAEREARGVDPQSQANALLAALQAQSEAQTRYQSQLVDVFQTVANNLGPGVIPAGPG